MTGLMQVGIDFVSTGEDKVKKAYADLGRAEDQLQQKMTVGVNTSQKSARSLDQIVAASKKAENEIRRLAQAKQQGKINSGQFQGELNKISARLRSMGMDKAQSQVFKLGRSYNTATTEVTKQTAELKKLQSALNQTATTKGRVTAATNNLSTSKVRVAAAARSATDATSRTRQAFLNTANSIAILDGPLGGIASRFSAFGVLIGRTGVLLGVALAGFSALGVVSVKSVRAFMDFEVQTAKIEAILKTTGSQAGLTASEIEGMASRIALSTLESEDAIRSAATQLLTFKNVGKDVFEATLKAATDMAALGFGTVESEAVKLAKALEDPRQSLTSLSRSGITFTRQQRQLIASLVESGRQAEAMDRILANVNRQVGGAGEAAARNTMAGDFDTIGQAVGRATRDLGQFIANTLGASRVVGAIAESLAEYAGGPRPLQDQVADLRKEMFELRQEAERELREQNISADSGIYKGVMEGLRRINEFRQVEVDRLEELIKLEEQAASGAAARNQIVSRTSGVDNILAQADALRENIGLTETQIRLNSMLAAEGFLNVDISEAVREYRDNLVAAGADQFVLTQAVEEFTLKLLEGEDAAKELAEALDLAELGRQFVNNSRSIEDQNSLLESQLALMDDGIGASEARRQAELNLQLAQAETLRLAKEITDEDYEQLRAAILKNQALSADLARTESATEEIERNQDLIKSGAEVLNTVWSNLKAIVSDAADDAGRFADNLVLGQGYLDAAVRSGVSSGAIPPQALQDLPQTPAQKAMERILDQRRRDARRPDAPDTPSGGASNVVDINAILDSRRQQIEQERVLLGLSGQQREAQAIYFDLLKQNEEAVNSLTKSELMRAANVLAAEQENNRVIEEGLKRQQDISNLLESSMERAFMSIVDGTATVKDAFKAMASEIIKELYRIFVVKQITGMIANAVFPGSGALVANANGNAFSNGNVVPFADGGIVGSPTTFPMSGGKTGLMGEAGPEAIMPLKRGKDGKLGVAADGDGAVTVNNYFTVTANGDDSVKRIVRQQIPQIAEATKAAVVDSKRRGGSYGRAFG